MRNPALQRTGLSIDEYRRVVRDTLAPHRRELLEKQAQWIRRHEDQVREHLIRGGKVNVDRIRPSFELVTTDEEHELWRYCRLMGTIPYNRGCGRLLRYLLRDRGQPGAPIMGVAALSSPVLINKPRDQWIGWEWPRDQKIKRRRLLACMDLTVSMAVPPYNHLTAGKMICLAVLSNEVREAYWNKFHAVKTSTGLREARLALITTTSLYGSSVQYNRLRVEDGPAYVRVGYTSGFGNAHVTERRFAQMERYLRQIGRPIPKGWGTGRSYRLRVYTAYCRHRYGSDHAPSHEHPRSVYVAALGSNAREFLRGEENDFTPFDLPIRRLVKTWKRKWLKSRLGKDDVLERFVSTDPADYLLTRELNAPRPKRVA